MCSPPDVYVQALYDFEYETEDGKQIWMREGEEYLLLKKTNGDWWQVIRDGDKRPFYAPANYVEEISQPGLPVKKLKKKKLLLLPPAVALSTAVVTANGGNSGGHKAGDSQSKGGSVRLSMYSPAQNVTALPPPLVGAVRPSANKKPVVLDNSSSSQQAVLKKPVAAPPPLGGVAVTSSKTIPAPLKFGTDAKVQGSSSKVPPGTNNNIAPTIGAPVVQLHSHVIVANRPASTLEHTTLLGKANYRKEMPAPVEQAKEVVATKHDKEKDNRLITEEQDKNRRNRDLLGQGRMVRDKAKELLSLNSLEPCSANGSKESSPTGQQQQDHGSLEVGGGGGVILETNLHSPTPNSAKLPPGWSRKYDADLKEVYYVNDVTKEKWFTSTDESGHIYYFKENASESFWQLPEVVIAETDPGSKNKLTTSSRLTTSSGSLIGERNNVAVAAVDVAPKSLSPRRRPMSVVDRGSKARSMVLADSRPGLSSGDDFKEMRSSTLPKSHTSIILESQKVLFHGMLSKTKVSEGGKKMRKNWTTFMAVLIDSALLFFKDVNKSLKELNLNKADSVIELIGSQIEWAPEKSTRKNVFQVSTLYGQQYLLQDDDAQSAKKWFDVIQDGIKMRFDGNYIFNSDPFPEDSRQPTTKMMRSTLPRRIEGKGSIGSSSEDLDSSSTEKKTRIRDKLKAFFLRRPTMESLQEQGIIKDEPVFGCTLTALCAKEKSTIPKFVQSCIAAIEKKDMTADGLYRASGNLSQIQRIRFQVNQDNLDVLDTEEDIHVLTGALKMFFRELKEPLFPFNTFERFLKAIASPDNSKKVSEFKDLILNSLPKPNYYTLKALLEHLLRVTDLSDKNRMHIQNLAIVFGPTLMWSATEPVDIALDVIHQNQIIEFLLMEFGNIFR